MTISTLTPPVLCPKRLPGYAGVDFLTVTCPGCDRVLHPSRSVQFVECRVCRFVFPIKADQRTPTP